MDWLPTIGTVAAPAFIAAFIEFLKAYGIVTSEETANIANLITSTLWCGLAVAMNIWPGAEPWIVAVITFVYSLLGAAGFYRACIKKITKKRYNRW